jgi:hypothetical protein
MSDRPLKPKASRQAGREPLAPGLPLDQHQEELIDEALTETFPASDPIAVPTPEALRRQQRSC